MRAIGFIIAAIFLFAMPAASDDASNASRLAGWWTGEFEYDGGAGAPGPFTLNLTAQGANVVGMTAEFNTFGDPSAAYLYATISGHVEGDRLIFVKTYDGTGGQSHSVTYDGVIDRTGNLIAGRWRIGSMSSVSEGQGTFRAVRRD